MFDKFFSSQKALRYTLATGELLLIAIPVGIACIGLGFIMGENPCIMCWGERFAMVYLGVLLMMMLRYGLKTRYLAAYALWAFIGMYYGLRHVGTHIWRDVGQGFGSTIMGAHTYSWAVFVYWVAVFSIFFLLLFLRKGQPALEELAGKVSKIHDLERYPKAVVIMSFFVIIANGFQAFLENGPPPYMCKGRPARVTLDLSKVSGDWNFNLWKKFTMSATWRASWDPEEPYMAGIKEKSVLPFSTDPATGPIALAEDKITVLAKHHIPFKAEGWNGASVVTGISWQPQMRKYAFVTGNAGLFYTDETISKMTDRAILDYPNGNDLRSVVDATFMGTKLIGLAYNKTIFASELTDPSKIDAWWQWRIFREATPAFAPVWGFNRPFLGTARAKFSFVTSASYDEATNSLFLASVPNQFQKHSVLMAFDMADQTIVSERDIKAAPKLQVKDSKKPLGYYITGMAMYEGKLLAISKNFMSMLVIDPVTAHIEKVMALPKELSDPHSLALADGKLVTMGREGGKDVVYEISLPSVK